MNGDQRLVRQLADTSELLAEALRLVEGEVDRQDGHDYLDLDCGNCDAGAPIRHSWGCRTRNLLRKLAEGES